MAKRGKMIYVPQSVLEELDRIEKEDRVNKRSKAFKKMVKYSKVGREARKIFTLRW